MTKMYPFIEVEEYKKTEIGLQNRQALVDEYFQVDHGFECGNKRLGAILMALVPQQSQVEILKHALSIYEWKSTSLANSIIQQAFHEAIENMDLRRLLSEQMKGPSLITAARHKDRLFDIMAYIHFLGKTKDVNGIEILCQDLQPHFGNIMGHNCMQSYKIFQKLAQLGQITDTVNMFFKNVLPTKSISEFAQRAQNNFIVSEVMRFTDCKHLDEIAHIFMGDMKNCIKTDAHYCLQTLCKCLKNRETLEKFSQAFVLSQTFTDKVRVHSNAKRIHKKKGVELSPAELERLHTERVRTQIEKARVKHDMPKMHALKFEIAFDC
jgi:hypothetical protein